MDPENYRFSRLDADSILLLEDGHCLRDHALAACKIRNTQKVQRICGEQPVDAGRDGRCRPGHHVPARDVAQLIAC